MTGVQTCALPISVKILSKDLTPFLAKKSVLIKVSFYKEIEKEGEKEIKNISVYGKFREQEEIFMKTEDRENYYVVEGQIKKVFNNKIVLEGIAKKVNKKNPVEKSEYSITSTLTSGKEMDLGGLRKERKLEQKDGSMITIKTSRKILLQAEIIKEEKK